MEWSERLIARELAVSMFAKRLVVVDNCNWTGHECDLLCVTTDMRIVDVEIKISRADLKADAKKDKWWDHLDYYWQQERPAPVARAHPPKVWKHYYALPAEIWSDSMFGFLPSPASGVVVLDERKDGSVSHRVLRRATPNRDASKITPAQAIDIARLANLRMWDAYRSLRVAESDAAHWRGLAQQREAA